MVEKDRKKILGKNYFFASAVYLIRPYIREKTGRAN